MKKNYQRCLKKVLESEGGYVNHPADPGGATNKGITQNTYNAWLKKHGKASASVRNIPMEHVEAIYRVEYWDRVKGDQLPPGVDLATFDFAVNSGVSRAAKFLQRVCGVTQDGMIGPATIAAIGPNTANDLCDARLAFLKGLNTWPTFGKGWGARVASVKSLSAEIARTYEPEPEIVAEVEVAPELEVAPPPMETPVPAPMLTHDEFRAIMIDLLAHDDEVRMEVYRTIYEIELQLNEAKNV